MGHCLRARKDELYSNYDSFMTNSYSRLFRSVLFYYRRVHRVQATTMNCALRHRYVRSHVGTPSAAFYVTRHVEAVLSVRYNLRVHFTRSLLE